jgi:MoaA/NifB/PqqE/SkfB family radical SAM enzyme
MRRRSCTVYDDHRPLHRYLLRHHLWHRLRHHLRLLLRLVQHILRDPLRGLRYVAGSQFWCRLDSRCKGCSRSRRAHRVATPDALGSGDVLEDEELCRKKIYSELNLATR